ncbi:melanotransferrin-like [Elysia marginata]|uniref:Melanotransferrin-like n=1 Tax=Elysia marginata TaxID=1093978 RepID=A0AAV4J1H2_9GAST|nr:melanotransferrin-like [Elysia marginata]
MSQCPSNVVRWWCVISLAEKLKCEDMIMAFKAKDLRPEMDCLYGGNTSNCMEMIWRGDADLMNLDAGDVYIAGRGYGPIPIAAEDYGDMTMQFKVVAAAHKTDKSTTLFNMKGKRSCQPGIGRRDGWIIPLNIYIETEQFLPDDCTIFRNIGELFTRSCIPGALDSEYNPGGQPINLCEGCAVGGFRKCQRNSDEQYYGATGAFRCLVESEYFASLHWCIIINYSQTCLRRLINIGYDYGHDGQVVALGNKLVNLYLSNLEVQ